MRGVPVVVNDHTQIRTKQRRKISLVSTVDGRDWVGGIEEVSLLRHCEGEVITFRVP